MAETTLPPGAAGVASGHAVVNQPSTENEALANVEKLFRGLPPKKVIKIIEEAGCYDSAKTKLRRLKAEAITETSIVEQAKADLADAWMASEGTHPDAVSSGMRVKYTPKPKEDFTLMACAVSAELERMKAADPSQPAVDIDLGSWIGGKGDKEVVSMTGRRIFLDNRITDVVIELRHSNGHKGQVTFEKRPDTKTPVRQSEVRSDIYERVFVGDSRALPSSPWGGEWSRSSIKVALGRTLRKRSMTKETKLLGSNEARFVVAHTIDTVARNK